VSVLRNRIVNQAGLGAGQPAGHPVGTEATPMEMPLAHVTYGDDEVALYGTLHPLVTADGAVIPAYSHAYSVNPVPAPVVPAGRP
jgi:hypothetical protein